MAVLNFELQLHVWNSTYVSHILFGVSYKVWFAFITKFVPIELFILILDILPLYTSNFVAILWHKRLIYTVLQANTALDVNFSRTVCLTQRKLLFTYGENLRMHRIFSELSQITSRWLQVLGILTNFAGPLYWSFSACRTVSKSKICC